MQAVVQSPSWPECARSLFHFAGRDQQTSCSQQAVYRKLEVITCGISRLSRRVRSLDYLTVRDSQNIPAGPAFVNADFAIACIAWYVTAPEQCQASRRPLSGR